MFQYTAMFSGVSGGFQFGDIEGYFAIMPNLEVNVNLNNDIELPPDIIKKFVPLAHELKVAYHGKEFYTNELIASLVNRIQGDCNLDNSVEAICQDLPEDEDAAMLGSKFAKPRGIVQICSSPFEPMLPALAKQVQEYEQFLDYMESSVIGGPSAQEFIDPETKAILGEEFDDKLRQGIPISDVKFQYPRAVAAWKGVLLRRGYNVKEVQDPMIGKVEVFSPVKA